MNVYAPGPRKGWLAKILDGDLVARMYFQYNPPEKESTQSVNYTFNSPPGSPLPTAIFGNVEGDEFNISLLFDASGRLSGDLVGTTAQREVLGSLVQIDARQYLNATGAPVSPPVVMFGFGKFYSRVVVTKLVMRDKKFTPNLIPIRTEAEISMKAIFTGFDHFDARMRSLERFSDMVMIKEAFGAAIQGL